MSQLVVVGNWSAFFQFEKGIDAQKLKPFLSKKIHRDRQAHRA